MGDTRVALLTPRRRRALRVIPLVLVSAAWTTHGGVASSVLTTAPSSPVQPVADPLTSPLGPLAPVASVPSTVALPGALTAPLSARVASGTAVAGLGDRPDPTDIPSAALAAYQRAET
ncbi:MAG: hypothetical protein WB767_06390, partial [Nocardioides sp.]